MEPNNLFEGLALALGLPAVVPRSAAATLVDCAEGSMISVSRLEILSPSNLAMPDLALFLTIDGTDEGSMSLFAVRLSRENTATANGACCTCE